VVAVDEEGRASIESETWLFWTNTELEPPNPFILLSPSNGEEGLSTTPEFVWATSTDNDPYDYAVYNLLISEDSTFTQVDYLVEGLSDTFFVMSEELTDNTQYFWRVDAIDTDSLVTSSEVYSFVVGTLSITDGIKRVPTEYSLSQNYPNPFNPVTTIQYGLAKSGYVNITVYNSLGQKMTTLVNKFKPVGYHTIQWDVSGVGTGIYFYRIQVSDYTAVRKCLILK